MPTLCTSGYGELVNARVRDLVERNGRDRCEHKENGTMCRAKLSVSNPSKPGKPRCRRHMFVTRRHDLEFRNH